MTEVDGPETANSMKILIQIDLSVSTLRQLVSQNLFSKLR